MYLPPFVMCLARVALLLRMTMRVVIKEPTHTYDHMTPTRMQISLEIHVSEAPSHAAREPAMRRCAAAGTHRPPATGHRTIYIYGP